MASTTNVTIEELAELLECPVCYQNTKLELYIQCRNGHFGCSKCLKKLKTCPICRVGLRYKIKSFSTELIRIAKNELKLLGAAQLFDSQKIMDMFKCTVCCNVPTANPVSQCTKGHIKCETCSPFYRSHCPLCFENSMGLQRIIFHRSQITEKILEKVVKPCRFQCYGCKEVITELGNHEKDVCMYRFINYYRSMINYFRQLWRLMTDWTNWAEVACALTRKVTFSSARRKTRPL